MKDFCTIDAGELRRALDLLASSTVEVTYSEPLPGFVALSIGDSVIPARPLQERHKERSYTVSLSRTREAVAALDGDVTVSDDGGTLVLAGVNVSGASEPDSDEDTKESEPIKARALPSEVAYLPVELPKLKPTTKTFRLLRAARSLSAAENRDGAPVIERVRGGYAIRVGAALAYGIGITEPAATIVTLHAKVGQQWQIVEKRRMPKLRPDELLNLFVKEETP